MRILPYLTAILALLFTFDSTAQRIETEFGKNRVQYHDDFKEWMQYESKNFITYWYGEGRNIGQSVVQMAELDYDFIQSILEHSMNNKIEVIVYTDLTDVKQSNIGNEEAFVNTGGQTKIVDNKVFVYFDGNHNNLRRDLREGIASVFLNAMLFGSNLQEIVQNAVLLNLPAWFKDGLVSYVGAEWNTEQDNLLRDLMSVERYQSFEKLSEDYPKLAGHAMWYFISQNYGKSTVANLLYLTRINRSIESGFLYVLGSSYDRTSASCIDYFKNRYEAEAKNMTVAEGKRVEIKNKRNLPLTQIKISPDGKKMSYVANEIGKYRVYIQDLATGERKVVLKEGFRNAFQETDYNYPLVAWNPNNLELAVLYERRDVPKLMLYDLTTKESVTEDLSTQYQRVYSMEYVNAFNLVFSATVRGFSDIFIYKTKTRQTERITNDFYDDLDAAFVTVKGRRGIVFASNRLDPELRKMKMDSLLPTNTFDIYYYDLIDRSTELVQVTNTPYVNERKPMAIDSTWFAYLSDESGLNNRHTAYLDSIIAFYEQHITLKDGTKIILHEDSTLTTLDTALIQSTVLEPVYKLKAFSHAASNFDRSLISQNAARRSNRGLDVLYRNGEHQVYVYQPDPEKRITPIETHFQGNRKKMQKLKKQPKEIEEDAHDLDIQVEIEDDNIEEKIEPEEEKKEEPVKEGYLFQSEFDEEEDEDETIEDTGIADTEDIEPTIVNDEDDQVVQKPLYNRENEYEGPALHRFRSSRIIPYRLKFKTDYVTTQLDNSPLFGGMDGVLSDSTLSAGNDNPASFRYSPPGILLKANFKDLFEDYEVEGGVRIPTTFNGAEYFLVFHDRKKRLDKSYVLYRKGLKFNDAVSQVPPKRREIALLGRMEVRYPLDIFTSLRASATLRMDKRIQLSTDASSLDRATLKNQMLSVRGEYVFDNTMNIDLNIKHGSRYKFYAEVFKRMEVDFVDEFKFNLNKGIMSVVGFDARHYQRLDKHSILALRGAGATSFGADKMLFYLGGVENWLFPRTNNEIPVPDAEEFAYKMLAANMRGFKTNIRNGASFAVVNTELRVPIFKYFAKRIPSSFFRNFQVIGFFDAGTAWHGLTPYSKDNPLNTRVITTPGTITVKVNYFKDPIIAGYGLGVRSVLFGYFLRLDYAWGIETRVIQEPRFYLSLGTDF